MRERQRNILGNRCVLGVSMRNLGLDWKLEQIARQINKIEDKCIDYRNNRTWQDLRRKQDGLYEIKRRLIENEREL